MTTELPNTTEATRRDGSPLTKGLGLAPKRMGLEDERARFSEWIVTAAPFDAHTGMVEHAVKTTAAWHAWQARAAMEDSDLSDMAEQLRLYRDGYRWRDAEQEEPAIGQSVLAVIYPYNNTQNARIIVHAIYRGDGRYIECGDTSPLHQPTHWTPAPVLPEA